MVNHRQQWQAEVRARQLRLAKCEQLGHLWDAGFFGREVRCDRCGACADPPAVGEMPPAVGEMP
jgi:hypothetical protein